MKNKLPSNLLDCTCNPTATNPELFKGNMWYAGSNKDLAVGNPLVVAKLDDPMNCKSTQAKGKKSLV